ncbi:MAG TPA: hypothetical protein VD971_10515 [Phycisphaerales bacterium]|nr:hypothetical protein [Phycisphaerales bacterium]
MPHRRLPAALLVCLAACGCSTHPIGRSVPVQARGDAAPGGSLRVEIENTMGSIQLDVDARADGPVVQASSLGSGGDGPAPEGWVAAQLDAAASGPVLRVLAGDPTGSGTPVNLRITVPTALGVSVRNNGGAVTLIGVNGPLDISNGLATGRGGKVTVTTSRDLSGPVTIKTRTGDIIFAAGPGTSGRFELRGARGSTVLAPAARNSESAGAILRITLGNADKPFILRADDGAVTVRVGK